jgi:DNA-binding HxlR family transcriptional regulator
VPPLATLRAGPRRFGELRFDIPRIPAKMLSARPRELISQGVVHREVRLRSPFSAEYSLTSLGKGLVAAIEAIVKVGHKLKDVRAPRASVLGSGRA